MIDMARVNAWISVPVLLAAIATSAGAAQAVVPNAKVGGKRIARTVEASALLPFAVDAPGGPEGVEFRSTAAMTPEDRQLLGTSWAAIQNQAAEAGFDLQRKGWAYEQIVSPVFREHVLLLFWRDSSADERSEFSAIVPRKDEEPLPVIPILRRGYFPYSTPQENVVTMAAFNRAMASERAHEKPYWLSVSLCYAALSGAHIVPQTAMADEGGNGAAAWTITPSLRIANDGGAVAQFGVENAPGRFAAWELTFDKEGNVVNAVTSPVKAPKVRVVRVEAPKRVRAVK